MTAIPAYVSKGRLASELDMAESTVDEMVKRGTLPASIKLSTGCVRWCWADVVLAIGSLKTPGGSGKPVEGQETDPYVRGAKNVHQITEGCRDAS